MYQSNNKVGQTFLSVPVTTAIVGQAGMPVLPTEPGLL
jgi:hypothetical protein